jgi:hypothetical protein
LAPCKPLLVDLAGGEEAVASSDPRRGLDAADHVVGAGADRDAVAAMSMPNSLTALASMPGKRARIVSVVDGAEVEIDVQCLVFLS